MIDRFLEGWDLRAIHTFATLACMFLAVYLMKLTDYVDEDVQDPWLIRKARRLTLLFIALAQLWSLSYSETKGWQPWPPDLAIDLTIIALLCVRTAAIHARLVRDGDRWPFTRPFAAHHSHVIRKVPPAV